MKDTAHKSKKTVGRPATDISEKTRLTIFLDPALRDEIEALGAMKKRTLYQLAEQAFRCLIDGLSPEDKTMLAGLVESRKSDSEAYKGDH